jgi:hypothetical protein
MSEPGDQFSPLTLQYNTEAIDWPENAPRNRTAIGALGKS